MERYVSQLQEMFPDCDPNHIRQCLAQQKSDHVNNVANILAEGNYPKINSKSRQSTSSTNPYNDDLGMKKLGWNIIDKVKDYVTSPSLVNGNNDNSGPLTSSKPIESPVNKEPSSVTPESTLNLRKSLRDAVRTCRSNSGSVIDSKASVKVVNESQTSYCDVISGHSLYCVGSLQDIELYIPNGTDKSEILSQSLRAPLIRFVNILKDLVEVFELAPKAVHVFFDNNASSIAFNRERSLFFNLKFYLGLHDEQCKNKPSSDALTYWFMTFCHELAHNFVSLHNSEHEYYFSSFAENYMTNFLAIMKKRGIL